VTIPTEGTLPAALQAQWPYAPNYINANGWRMHYVDEGEGDEKRRKERRCARGYRRIFRPFLRLQPARRLPVPGRYLRGLSSRSVADTGRSIAEELHALGTR
jgi:hypothetical protein